MKVGIAIIGLCVLGSAGLDLALNGFGLLNFFGLMLSGADSTPRIDMRMVEDRPNGELWVPDEFRDGVEAMQSWVKQRQEPVRQQVA